MHVCMRLLFQPTDSDVNPETCDVSNLSEIITSFQPGSNNYTEGIYIFMLIYNYIIYIYM